MYEHEKNLPIRRLGRRDPGRHDRPVRPGPHEVQLDRRHSGREHRRRSAARQLLDVALLAAALLLAAWLALKSRSRASLKAIRWV